MLCKIQMILAKINVTKYNQFFLIWERNNVAADIQKLIQNKKFQNLQQEDLLKNYVTCYNKIKAQPNY